VLSFGGCGIWIGNAAVGYAKEKLELLQRFDQFRQWGSLDEKRYCLVCGKIIAEQ